jgi:hypothetical protein
MAGQKERKVVLTLMATVQQLETRGELVGIEVELDPDEEPQRLIYALPSVIEWMDDVLPGLETDGYIPGANRPIEQAEAQFYSFVSGKTTFEMPPHPMRPEEHGVWVLRTHDLRFFGFFLAEERFHHHVG